MRTFTLLAFVVAINFCQGQKAPVNYSSAQYKTGFCRSSFTKIKMEGSDLSNPDVIQKILYSLTPNLADARSTVKLNYVRQSIGGYHYSFTQLFNGVPVYQSEIKVNVDKNNTVRSVFDNSYNTANWPGGITTSSNLNNTSVIAIDPTTTQPVLAQRTIVNHNLETITAANGTVIFQTDINCYFAPPDSTVVGKVFNPDPLTTSEHLFDTSTIYCSLGGFDGPWLDEPWLDAQEQEHSFIADYDNGVFSLSSPFVQLTNYSTYPPDVTPVTSTTGQFYFNRSQSGFQDVNAFYHISAYHNYVHGLGFNCADSFVYIDTHATLLDNSWFSWAYYPCQIYYGVGGVPDAEDADVVVHEYCHSLSYTAAPQTNVGTERRSLDEGFCDYNASSYSKSINPFYDQWVYNWDGHNSFWPGRVVNSSKVYPIDLDESIYDNGEMWSAALFSINGDIGRGATDSLIIETNYSYAQNISMAYAAQLLIDADSILFNGAHYCYIYSRLLEHSFVPQVDNGCTVSAGIANNNNPGNFTFMQHGNSFTLMNNNSDKITVQILDITGREVARPLVVQDVVVNYENSNLSSGMYVINVLAVNGTSSAFKWCKVR